MACCRRIARTLSKFIFLVIFLRNTGFFLWKRDLTFEVSSLKKLWLWFQAAESCLTVLVQVVLLLGAARDPSWKLCRQGGLYLASCNQKLLASNPGTTLLLFWRLARCRKTSCLLRWHANFSVFGACQPLTEKFWIIGAKSFGVISLGPTLFRLGFWWFFGCRLNLEFNNLALQLRKMLIICLLLRLKLRFNCQKLLLECFSDFFALF